MPPNVGIDQEQEVGVGDRDCLVDGRGIAAIDRIVDDDCIRVG